MAVSAAFSVKAVGFLVIILVLWRYASSHEKNNKSLHVNNA